MDLKSVKLSKKWLEENIDCQLLQGFYEVGVENKIVRSVTKATTASDFINRLIAANICLVQKSDKLEEQVIDLLANKLDSIKTLGETLKDESNTKLPSGS